MSALDSSLTAFLVKATLILVAVLAAHVVLRRSSAATRHLVLTLAMFGLVALPLLALSVPAWQLEVLPRGSAGPMPTSAPLVSGDTWVPAPATAPVPATNPSAAAEQATAGHAAVPASRWDPSRTLLGAWALGTAIVLAKLLVGLLRMRGIVRNGEEVTDRATLLRLDDCSDALGLRSRPRLVASNRVEVPLVLGWLRPVLVVPAEFTDWSDDRVRAVLLHELGHLKRNDWPLLVLGRVVAAVYWFHPLVWYLERCARRECERACDDLVVTCGTRPSEYAGHLLSIARGVMARPAGMAAALAVVRRSQLKSRLRSILDPVLRRNAPSRTAVAGLSTALMLVLLPVASLQFAEQARAEEPGEPEEILLAQHSKQYEQQHKKSYAKEETEAARLSEKGYKLHKLGRYAEAIEVWQEALDQGFRPGPTKYNIACGHARMRDTVAAIEWLEQAIDAGFDNPENLVKDSDFDPIRSEPRFQEFIDSAFRSAGMERSGPNHYPYRTALENFDQMRASNSSDGKRWAKLGHSMLAYGELDRSIEAFNRAVELSGGADGTTLYNTACAYSLAGRTGAALEWLERAVDAGFGNQERFQNDTDLDSLRSSPEFDRIAEKSEFLSLKRFPRRHGEDSNYSPERWAPAVAEFREFVRENPDNGRGWFNLGYALHGSRSFDEAIEAFEAAVRLDYHTQTATFNIACGNAMLGRTDSALDLLEQAAAAGGIHHGQLESDSDLDSLRDDPRFQALLDQLEDEKAEYEQKMKHKKMKEQQMKYEMKQKQMQMQKQQQKAQADYEIES